MAAAIKAINARIRSNKALDYFCSTRTFGLALSFFLGFRMRELVACRQAASLRVVCATTK